MALKVQVAANGDRQVGETHNGVFVPYLTVPLWRIEQIAGSLDKGNGDESDNKKKGGE